MARNKSPSRSCGEVDDELGVATPHFVKHFTVVLKLHRRFASFRVAHMDMHGSCTSFCCCQTLVRNLCRSDGQVGRLVWRGDVASDGAGEKSFLAHGFIFLSIELKMSAAIDHDARSSDITHGGGAGLHNSCDIVDCADAFERNSPGYFFVEICAASWHERGVDNTR